MTQAEAAKAMSFGDRLKWLAEQRGINFGDFCAKCRAISIEDEPIFRADYEPTRIGIAALIRLRLMLNAPLDFLLWGEGPATIGEEPVKAEAYPPCGYASHTGKGGKCSRCGVPLCLHKEKGNHWWCARQAGHDGQHANNWGRPIPLKDPVVQVNAIEPEPSGFRDPELLVASLEFMQVVIANARHNARGDACSPLGAAEDMCYHLLKAWKDDE